MASESQRWEQQYFFRGIGRSRHLPEEGAVADMLGVDVVSEYGVVTLGRLPDGKTPTENIVEYTADGQSIVGKNIVGTGATGQGRRKYVFFQSWSYVAQDGTQDAVVPSSPPVNDLFHAVYVPEMGYTFFVCPSTNSGLVGGVDVFYVSTDSGSQTMEAKIDALNRSNLPADFKDLGGGTYITVTDAGFIQSIYIDNSLYLSIGAEVYRIYLVDVTLKIEKVVELEYGMGVVRMIPHGDSLYLYATDQINASPNPAESGGRRSVRYIWQRGSDRWSTADEIPGTFFDAINYNGTDILFWDENIGYFSGDELVVLKRLPALSDKQERPVFKSAALSGNFITFLTARLVQKQNTPATDRYYEDDGLGLYLWRFGREEGSTPFTLDRVGVYYSGYGFIDGELSSDGYGAVFFGNLYDLTNDPSTQFCTALDGEWDVQYMLYSQDAPNPHSDTYGESRYVSFVQPFNPRVTATSYRASGYVVTQEIGRESGLRKTLSRVGLRARMVEHTQVKVSVAIDGSDTFVEVGVFEPAHTNTQWALVSAAVQPFYTMQLKVELVSANGTVSPVLYGVMAEYDVQSDV